MIRKKGVTIKIAFYQLFSHILVVFPAYAKINLGLRVLARRPDGYHDIETVFHRIALCDELSFSPAPALSLSADGIDVPVDETNLCLRAATLLAAECRATAGAHIVLRKRVPVGAGLGGGSADAAVVLRELPRFWGIQTDLKRLNSMALQLGSDVPFFLGRGSAYARGRGEQLEYFTLALPYAILVVHPGIHVSTAWAYSQITPHRHTGEPSLKELLLAGLRDPSHMLRGIVNDFETPVFTRFPQVREIKDAMHDGGALFALMSGSGSSVFGLFEQEHTARSLAERFQKRGFTVSITTPGFSA